MIERVSDYGSDHHRDTDRQRHLDADRDEIAAEAPLIPLGQGDSRVTAGPLVREPTHDADEIVRVEGLPQ